MTKKTAFSASDQNQQNRRLHELQEMIMGMASLDFSKNVPLTGKGDVFDAIALGLNNLSEELSKLTVNANIADNRLSEFQNLIMAYASRDFNPKAEITGKGDLFDAISLGLNMLGEELKETTVSKDYISNIFNSMTDAVCVIDENKKIQTVNKAALSVFGYSENELLSQKIDIFFDSNDEFIQSGFFTNFLRIGSVYNAEKKLIKKDLSEIPVSFSASLMKTSEKIDGIVCIAHDITERKKIEEEKNKRLMLETKTGVLEAQNRIRGGLNSLNDITSGRSDLDDFAEKTVHFIADYLDASMGSFYIFNEQNESFELQGRYAFDHNEKIPESFKYKEGLIGQCAYDGKPKLIKDVPDNYIKIKSSIGEKKPDFIYIMPCKSESAVLGVLELAKFKNFHEEHTEFLYQASLTIGNALNITLSKLKTEQLLLDSQKLTEELQSQSEELQETNEQLEEQTKALEQTQHHLEERNNELEKTHRELEYQTEELKKVNSYKSEFLANMSHELRTPLNSILILSKLLSQNKNERSPEEKKQAETIYEAGGDLLNLINDILDLSKIEAGKLKLNFASFNVKELAEEIINTFKPQIQDHEIRLIQNISPDLPDLIRSDKERISQIINNFLSNALKFTEKGTITFSVEKPSEGGNGEVAFSVKDTGIGISEKDQKNIFKAFEQADSTINKNFQGTGLGLAISQNLTELLGGRLTVESTPGQGSCFSLILPADAPNNSNQNQGEMRETATQQTFSPSRSKTENFHNQNDDRDIINRGDKVLLIIEDDRRFADILKNKANEESYKVIIASSGTTGLSYAHEYQPAAIILDIKIPVFDGWQVLQRLKRDRETRHIPVQIISVIKEDNFAYKLGALNHIKKPIENEELESVFDLFKNEEKNKEKTILIVEDNKHETKAITDLINGDNLKIRTVSSGYQALEILKQQAFNCIILDLKIPDMSGFELLKSIKDNKTHEKTPVIVYTGKELTKDEETSLRGYANSIILKTADSPARLLDETMLFLHQVNQKIDSEKTQMFEKSVCQDKLFQNKEILIVDDDLRNTYALTAVLEEQGLNVSAAGNGEEALNMIINGEKSFDLVLMDIMMPVKNGYETIRELRQNKDFENLPVIALTAKAMQGERERCLREGASDYISKPIDYDQLISLIRIWLHAKP